MKLFKEIIGFIASSIYCIAFIQFAIFTIRNLTVYREKEVNYETGYYLLLVLWITYPLINIT